VKAAQDVPRARTAHLAGEIQRRFSHPNLPPSMPARPTPMSTTADLIPALKREFKATQMTMGAR